MKLATFAHEGRERLGLVFGDRVVLATELDPSFPETIESLLVDASHVLPRLRRASVLAGTGKTIGSPLADVVLRAPAPRPGKIVAVGLNYRDHAAESGAAAPAAPLLFAKFTSSVVGPGDLVRWDPGFATEVDYEAELAIVIGTEARRVSRQDARRYVLGYTCANDVSARDLQFGDGQWVRGKSLDTFCPLGPVLVTADELTNPNDLRISCTVNGEVLQDSSTSEMFFGVDEIVSYCSEAFTLQPGDVIITGTPAGVGTFRQPPRRLGDGDVVVVEIEGIGRLENTCRFERAAAAAR